MKITCKTYPLENGKNNVLAMVSLTIEEKIVVTGIRLLDGKKGKFISFPSYKTKDDEYKDIVYPLNKELRDKLTKLVVTEYEKTVKEKSSNSDEI